MKLFFPLLLIFLSTNFSRAQCEFPFNSGTRQFTDAIEYSGEITTRRSSDGSIIYSVDPSKLSLKENETFQTRLQISHSGQWFYKWHYSTTPNHWQPLMVGCNLTEVSILFDPDVFSNNSLIECDFFYLDLSNKVSAGFMGTVSTSVIP